MIVCILLDYFVANALQVDLVMLNEVVAHKVIAFANHAFGIFGGMQDAMEVPIVVEYRGAKGKIILCPTAP